jgi:AcrR family transcriptional regulator
MAQETEQKILDAALKLFAKEGYKGATTRLIAKESGFNELTLFRKFGNKKNLYDQVIDQNIEKMLEDYKETVLIEKKFENTRDFLETFVKNSIKTLMDNFEVFYLSVNEDNLEFESTMEQTYNFIGEYIKKNIPNKKIDYKIFALTINSFVYVINNEKYHGRMNSFGKSHEETIENVIEILYCMVDS